MHRLSKAPSLLTFDLDGTLAPLAPLACDARVPPKTVAYLKALSNAWPLGVITGRAIEDAKTRLGFEPRYLFGNHGAEREHVRASAVLIAKLNPCREHLHRHRAAMQARWIALEDKELSLALHYPHCPNVPIVRTWLDALLEPIKQHMCASHGHNVTNIVPKDSPDKGDALLEIMHDCKASKALVVGDDVNDEAAFAKAPAGSVTVKIGPSHVSTQARFRLSAQSHVDRLLETLLALRA